jgi:hypothetical protein
MAVARMICDQFNLNGDELGKAIERVSAFRDLDGVPSVNFTNADHLFNQMILNQELATFSVEIKQFFFSVCEMCCIARQFAQTSSMQADNYVAYLAGATSSITDDDAYLAQEILQQCLPDVFLIQV